MQELVEVCMMDLIYLGAAALFFILSYGLIRLSSHLSEK